MRSSIVRPGFNESSDYSSCIDVGEYLSRWARWRLVSECVGALRKRRRVEGGVFRGVVGEFAGLVGVSGRTVERWLACGVQSCNVNAERIVEIAFVLCPVEAEGILREDLENHRDTLEAFQRKSQPEDIAPVEVALG